jgi:hypothetical protein
VLRVLFLDLPGTKQSGVEVNVKDVPFFLLDEMGYIDSLGQEHVVTVQNGLSIKANISKGIETFEDEHSF